MRYLNHFRHLLQCLISLREVFFSYIDLEFPPLQLVPVSSCCISKENLAPSSLTHSHQPAITSPSPQPSLPQADQAQLLQSLLRHPVLQAQTNMVAHHGACSGTSVSLWYWGAPNWTQCFSVK